MEEVWHIPRLEKEDFAEAFEALNAGVINFQPQCFLVGIRVVDIFAQRSFGG